MKKINCNLCGSKNHFFYFLFKEKDRRYNIPGEFNVVKCKKCRLIFINPQPSQKELEKYYSKKYFTHNIIKDNFKEKIRQIIYRTYHKDNNIFLKLLFFPYHHLRGVSYKENGKILDIGCGNGRFLLDCKKCGWDVYGVEADKEAKKINELYGIKIFNDTKQFKNKYFDTITLWHVLEHLPDPLNSLKKINRILKRNGDLIIEIPITDSLAFKLFGKRWYGLDTPRHLYSFSKENMKEYFKKTGFKIVKIKYNSRPSQFIMSMQFIINEKTEKYSMKLKKNWFLKQCFKPIVFLINLLHMADNVIVYLKKMEFDDEI